ncbi:DsbE family thiol:disulfide interchange protein [Rhodospirillaceae bacterium KN72]|uniref:DsbE family thiol:disulfide interchange protein n=1 Tax=Pacificispira spongiicola TaxID=2729598 RepID=A0A7Y0E0I4_9PROT|nr:DsbE family thiol:disulfide interchange protein [Pacificispira spongiicola]NMM44951.1 DsbE family thiol:disulfide interchange protein [Pacificispira spongiicola]
MTDTASPKPTSGRRWLFAALPLVLFAALAGAFFYQLRYGTDPKLIPSALIGDPVPQTVLEPLKSDKPGFGPDDFGPGSANGQPILVNVFASWCVPCRVEHPIISALARERGIPVYGLNSKDKREDAIRWLNELGDPYTRIGYDPLGRAGIDWGVYGYPETFLVSPKGEVVYKYVGPITPQVLEREFLPRLDAFAEGAQ